MLELCTKCSFFKVDAVDIDCGRCRRYPPVMVPDNEDDSLPYEWAYPFVGEDDSCGEFKAKPEE